MLKTYVYALMRHIPMFRNVKVYIKVGNIRREYKTVDGEKVKKEIWKGKGGEKFE